jgi:glycosyltransferase involved in cell wall biosynthesis
MTGRLRSHEAVQATEGMNNQNKRRILVVSFSQLDTDPRVHRQLIFLKEVYKVTAAGFGRAGVDKVDFIELKDDVKRKNVKNKILSALNLKTGRFDQFYWSSSRIQNARDSLRKKQFDLIIANDINSLPLAYYLSRKAKAKLLLDAHEYAPRESETQFLFRFFYQTYWDRICRYYLPRVDAMTTVGEGIANEYKTNYGADPIVITNAPFFTDLEPSQGDLRSIRMIYHGRVSPVRKSDNMISLMGFLDRRFSLDLMILGDNGRYMQKLHEMGMKHPRIKFVEPVPMPDIAKTINRYDIGLYFLNPSSFNDRMALPNKLFEFIQGRLAVAIWPSPEMARIVRKYRCGLVSEDFTCKSMAEILNNLTTNQIMKFKWQSHKAASELSADRNRELFISIIQELIG